MKKIALAYKNGTALSERKMAEKYNVSRSVIQRIKKQVASGEFKFDFDLNSVFNFEKALKAKSANQAPTKKSLNIFIQTNGDFELFAQEMNNKTEAYIKHQYLKCYNRKNNET